MFRILLMESALTVHLSRQDVFLTIIINVMTIIKSFQYSRVISFMSVGALLQNLIEPSALEAKVKVCIS